METKEHVFFALLFFSTYLSITVYASAGTWAHKPGARQLGNYERFSSKEKHPRLAYNASLLTQINVHLVN